MIRKKLLSVLLALALVLPFSFATIACEPADSVYTISSGNTTIEGSVNLTEGAVVGIADNQSVNSTMMGLISDTELVVVRVDASTHAIQIITHSHHEMHEEDYYYLKGWQDLTGAGTNLDFLWCVPNTTKWPHAQWNIAGEAEFTMTLYEAVTVSANGTPCSVFNVNRNSANVAGVKCYAGPTLAGGALGDGGQGGTAVWSSKIGSGKDATEGRAIGYEFIGKQNTDYWFRISKAGAGTEYVDYDFNWYEHTDKD